MYQQVDFIGRRGDLSGDQIAASRVEKLSADELQCFAMHAANPAAMQRIIEIKTVLTGKAPGVVAIAQSHAAQVDRALTARNRLQLAPVQGQPSAIQACVRHLHLLASIPRMRRSVDH